MIMLLNHETESARRPRGRPQVRSDEETRALIVEAAATEFQTKGFAATCIADVAQRASVSTKTLYRLIPNKVDLFESVVSARIGRAVQEIEFEIGVDPDPLQVVERMLIGFGELTLEAGTIAINRLVIGESANFPEIGKTFYERAIKRTSEAMERALRRLCALGLIELDDPAEATTMLRGMMIMEPQRAVMLGHSSPPNLEAIRGRAHRCASLFVRGCAHKDRSHPSQQV
jgi:AcrR family transcriptional regulator